MTSTGVLSLETLTPELEFLSPELVTLVVKLNGQTLPAGVQVGLTTGPGLTGFPASQLTEPGGLLTLPGIVAQAPGPLSVQATAYSLTSQPALFSVWLNPAQLSLTASPPTLEYLVPTNVDFTLRYQGQPLPAGLTVILTSPDQSLANLPTSVTQVGGVVPAPGIWASQPQNPLTAQATTPGLFANANASLGVYLRPEALSAQFELEPHYLPESVMDPHATGPFMASCQTYAVTITLTYQGRPLALTPVTLAGFAFNQNGREVVTNALGQVQGTLRYSRDNLADYQANPDWSITVAGVTVRQAGPLPIGFETCQP